MRHPMNVYIVYIENDYNACIYKRCNDGFAKVYSFDFCSLSKLSHLEMGGFCIYTFI